VESINNPISREVVEKLEDFYLNEVRQQSSMVNKIRIKDFSHINV
jgi:hypothetical protein